MRRITLDDNRIELFETVAVWILLYIDQTATTVTLILSSLEYVATSS
ncbi:MAG TPA: hypothetical protein VLB46_16700 [Pyrinomonadaceae bacterium]|nr:hypothetical protein [Pyrinomonadaceae bacterium]